MDPNPYPRAPMHACVIGGGITGASVAHELLQRGWRVTLLEAQSIASGATVRSAACVRAQWGTETNVRAMRWSLRRIAQLPSVLGTASKLYWPNGYLYPCFTPEQFAQRELLYQMQRSAGLAEVELLTAGEVRERFPHLTDGVKGATFCPIDGFCAPDLMTHELIEACRKMSAFTLGIDAEVKEVVRQGSKAIKAITKRVDVAADMFVNCTNAWAPRVARLFHRGVEKIFGAIPIAPVKRYLHFLKTGDAWSPEEFWKLPMTVYPSGAYCRPSPDGLMLGWEHEAEPEPDFDHGDQDKIAPGFGHQSEDDHGVRTWAELAQYSNVIAELPGIAHTTAGYYDLTEDHHPIIDWDRHVENLLHNCGKSGHGIMSAFFDAQATTHLLSVGRGGDKKLSLDGNTFDLRAFALDPRERLNQNDGTHL